MIERSYVRRLPGTIRRSLDRPGGRWVLGLSVSALSVAADHRPAVVRWNGSEWSYKGRGRTLLSNQLLRPRMFDEDLEIFLWDYEPSPGDVIVDVGAGTGTESVVIADAVGPTGRVIAIEAHPGTAAVLSRAGAANGLTNITVVVAAVADQPGTLRISNSDEFGVNSVFDSGVIEVQATTIDELLRSEGLDHIDFLKMNIEGAERLAIDGMSETVDRIDRMAISCHDFLGTDWGATRERVRAWLHENGFTVTSRPDDPRPWARDYLYASRNRE